MPLLSIVSQKPIDVTHFIGNNAGVSYAIAQFIMNIVDWVLGVVGLEKNTTVVTVIYSIVVLGVAIVAGYIVQWIVLKIVKAIAHRWDSDMYHALTNVRFFHKICRIIPPLVFLILIQFTLSNHNSLAGTLTRITLIYITFVMAMALSALVMGIWQQINAHANKRKLPLNGIAQLIKGIIWIVTAIIIVAIILDKSPGRLLAGLGAFAAVLMLIFKDSILGLVAGVQLSANDMLRPGDWITMSKYGADGYVIEVTLTTVKVQNFDKTITTIPPYALVSDSFQNWRGMWDSGGRRIKRSVFIDARTIRRCTPEETARLREKGYLAADTSQEIVNLQALREYLANYLRNCPDVRSDLMLMVRTLQPTSEGVPLEFYCFTRHFEWIPYEAFQSALTDRVLTLLPEFGLQAFQRPAGTDLHERH